MSGRLLMVTGAPGSGKTAVAPGLRRKLAGAVVLDMDQFLEAGSRLAGVDLRQPSAADRWPAQNDLCLTFVAAVLAADHDVLMLSPSSPEEVGRSAVAPELGDIRWAVLDCSDESRLDRLTMRSPAEDDEEGALADAADLRMLGLEIIQNDGIGVGEAVDRIGQWAQLRLTADENGSEYRSTFRRAVSTRCPTDSPAPQ